ncbi:hypothetical protein A6R68_18245 [Neotoma lepida]|uniref:Uncharacterized protein n=1 Tax=Neotoma lepida TaxID=56216 RepID=A0A1A6HN34_NEOLE|nr:hypothetical protein A6R68_18245 [Neotoma lepida]
MAPVSNIRGSSPKRLKEEKELHQCPYPPYPLPSPAPHAACIHHLLPTQAINSFIYRGMEQGDARGHGEEKQDNEEAEQKKEPGSVQHPLPLPLFLSIHSSADKSDKAAKGTTAYSTQRRAKKEKVKIGRYPDSGVSMAISVNHLFGDPMANMGMAYGS